MTIDTKNVSEEEQEKLDNTRWAELSKKEDQTDEEAKELGELKDRHASRTEKKINHLTWRAKTAEEEREKRDQEIQDMRSEMDTLRSSQEKEAPTVNDAITIGGKKYFTDDSLMSMVKNGEISNADAFKLSKERDKEEIIQRVQQDNVKKSEEDALLKQKQDDHDWMTKNYPQFLKSSPNFNPDDPHYKLADELYRESYFAHTNGMSLAVKRAKTMLKITNQGPDVSHEFSVNDSDAPERMARSDEDVALSQEEEETALRLWRDKTNPDTGKVYRESEILEKAKKSKKERKSRRM